MHWYLTIPFAVGIFLCPIVGMEMEWIGILLVAGMILLWWMNRCKGNLMPMVILNSFMMGVLYGGVRNPELIHTNNIAKTHSVSASQRVSKHQNSFVASAKEGLSETDISKPHQAVLNAMLLGDRDGLSREQRTMFRDAGAQHLLALSGMHLGLLLTLFSVLLLPRVRFSRWRWPALTGILVLMWSYAVAVGMPKSLMRAVVMTSLFLVGKFSLRPTRGYEILGTTILIMLVADPMCIFDMGAQLSMVALIGLTCFYPALRDVVCFSYKGRGRQAVFWLRRLNGFLRFFSVSLSAWLFTMPLILYYFHQFQPWQPVVSIFLIPLTTLVLYLALLVSGLCFLGCMVVATPLSAGLDSLMSGYDHVLHFSASLPSACVKMPDVTFLHVLLLYLLFTELWMLLHYRSRRVVLASFAASITTILLFSFM